MKKIFNLALTVILATCLCLTIAGCGSEDSAEDILKSFILEQDGNEVTEDFSVISSITVGENTYQLTWVSDNECVKVSNEVNESSKTYTMSVTRPEEEQDVTLTVTLTVGKNNQASKSFKVRVLPITVYDFTGSYVFAQKNQVVYTDFELDTSYEYKGKTCKMSWTSDNELIEIQVDGEKTKAIVTESDIETSVTLRCTFEYAGETSVKRYPVTVYKSQTAAEALAYWYNNTGVSQVLSGYVVEIAAEYSESYGNVSLYIVDDSFQGGYYLYRVKADTTEGAKIAVGVHVTVTGTTNTSYNGLIETNAGGNLVVDEDIDPIDVTETVYAIDNDLIANAQSLYYRSSTLVSLTNWQVKKVDTSYKVGDSTTVVLTVEKDGVETSVVFSKYVQAVDSTLVDAVNAKLGELAVGDYVNIQGVLSYYVSGGTQYKQSGYQIMITGTDSITDGVSDTTESAGLAVRAAIDSVTVVNDGDRFNANTEIELPSSYEGVAITWAFSKETVRTAVIKDGKLVITPTDRNESISLIATFTKGDYSTEIYYKLVTSLEEEPTVKIADANLTQTNQEIIIEGVVVATGSTVYYVYDGTGYIMINTYNSDVDTTIPEVGSMVKIKVTAYASYGQNIGKPVTAATESTLDIDIPTVTELTAEDILADATTCNQIFMTTGTVISKVSGTKTEYYLRTAVGDILLHKNNSVTSLYNTIATDENVTAEAEFDVTIALVSYYSSKEAFQVAVIGIDQTVKIADANITKDNQEIVVEGVVVGAGSTVYYIYDGTGYIMVNTYNSDVDTTIPEVGSMVKIKVTAYASYGQNIGKPIRAAKESALDITAPTVTELTAEDILADATTCNQIFTTTGTVISKVSGTKTEYYLRTAVGDILLHKNNSVTSLYNTIATDENVTAEAEFDVTIALISYYSSKEAFQAAVLKIETGE